MADERDGAALLLLQEVDGLPPRFVLVDGHEDCDKKSGVRLLFDQTRLDLLAGRIAGLNILHEPYDDAPACDFVCTGGSVDEFGALHVGILTLQARRSGNLRFGARVSIGSWLLSVV